MAETNEKEGILQKAQDVLKEAKEILTKTNEDSTEQVEDIVEGVEDTSVEDSTEDVNENPDGDVDESPEDNDDEELTQKSILKRLDALEQKEYKQEKTIESLKKENEKLKKTIDDEKLEKTQKQHKNLVKTAIQHASDLKMEDVVDEESLIKTMKSTGKFTDEQLEKDTDECIKSFSDGLVIAKSFIPEGYAPFTGDSHIHKEQDANKEEAQKLRKQLENRGKTTRTEDK